MSQSSNLNNYEHIENDQKANIKETKQAGKDLPRYFRVSAFRSNEHIFNKALELLQNNQNKIAKQSKKIIQKIKDELVIQNMEDERDENKHIFNKALELLQNNQNEIAKASKIIQKIKDELVIQNMEDKDEQDKDEHNQYEDDNHEDEQDEDEHNQDEDDNHEDEHNEDEDEQDEHNQDEDEHNQDEDEHNQDENEDYNHEDEHNQDEDEHNQDEDEHNQDENEDEHNQYEDDNQDEHNQYEDEHNEDENEDEHNEDEHNENKHKNERYLCLMINYDQPIKIDNPKSLRLSISYNGHYFKIINNNNQVLNIKEKSAIIVYLEMIGSMFNNVKVMYADINNDLDIKHTFAYKHLIENSIMLLSSVFGYNF
jgi:hypothetical protein